MKSEELLKNISDLLKKHENFLNNNPELFYAIENRLLKAMNDEDEDSDYDWANIGAGEQEDEDEDGSGYGDDLFDKIPSEDSDDEDERYIRGDAESEDDDGDDEASRWLRERGEDDGDEESDESGFDFDPDAARESDDEPADDLDEDEVVQPKVQTKEEPKKSSSRYVDWKPQDKYEPEHQKAIDEHMKNGYSHREAERLAGAHKAPTDFYSALRSGTKPSEPSAKMLEHMKGLSHEWLRNADRKQMESAEAENNPQKHATGKAIAAHEAAHKDFESAHNEFLGSDELKGLTGRARHQAIQAWKKDWAEKNPEHREKAVAAADSGKAFKEAMDIRDRKRDEGVKSYLESGKSFGGNVTGEYSQAAAGGDDGPMSAQAAGQSVGSEQNDEGGFSTNIKKDPAAVFADSKKDYSTHVLNELGSKDAKNRRANHPLEAFSRRNPEYVKKLQNSLNPEQTQRLSGIDSLKNKENK